MVASSTFLSLSLAATFGGVFATGGFLAPGSIFLKPGKTVLAIRSSLDALHFHKNYNMSLTSLFFYNFASSNLFSFFYVEYLNV